MIITFGNVKGGVGKTTLALNTAIARTLQGQDVLLIDGDEQGTAASFTELRSQLIGTSDYTAVSLTGAAVRTQTQKLASKYDDIVIDVGGRDTGSFRAALTVAEMLVIPFQPRTFDVWALDQVAELVTEARAINDHLRVYSVLNAADPTGRDNEDAARALAGVADIEYLPCPIVRRKAFPNAAAHGQSVLEYKPKDAKAIAELTTLINSLFNCK